MPDAFLNFLWLALCTLSGGMLAATLVRIGFPIATPEKWRDLAAPTKGLLLASGLVGCALGYFTAQALAQLDGQLYPTGSHFLQLAGLRFLLNLAAGALVGALWGQLGFATDYHELRVALLDFSGAPLLFGGVIGGVLGAWRGIAVWPGLNLPLQIAGGVGGSVVGLVIGSGLGLIAAMGIQSWLVLMERR